LYNVVGDDAFLLLRNLRGNKQPLMDVGYLYFNTY